MVTVKCLTKYESNPGADTEMAYLDYGIRCKSSIWAEQWNKLMEDAKKLWKRNPRHAVVVELKAIDDDGRIIRTWTTARKANGHWEVIR